LTVLFLLENSRNCHEKSNHEAAEDLVSSITSGFDDRKQTFSILYDFTKTFGCEFHSLLIISFAFRPSKH
jgi:hypothetical protein